MAWQVNGTVLVGIWAKKGGVWSLITTSTISIYQSFSTSGAKTIDWTLAKDFDLGTAVQAVGVTIESQTGTSAALTDFVSLSWQSKTTSGTRTATPGGELSVATVRPQ